MSEQPLAHAVLSDEILMQSYAAGQAMAFETLYQRHEQRLWRYFFRNTGDAALADDLSQDLWFSVVESATSYEIRSKFTTWLFTMAHHRLVDHWRRRRPGLSLGGDSEESQRLAESLFAASGFEPDHRLDRRLLAQLLLDALAQLPVEQRECFLLQVEADMTVADIAQATGVAEETAKSRLRYARSKLRQALEGQI
ncbi:sigma-70 family RNA polymerase sigma factor [Comamonas fluminis]|uniref:sigma-70 family RNA polymerase sigma factor n=1 Tax=Comamonas fluminis TaxID=2796366 RepID=UPI001FE571D8|nr:sigma-70 family RNA polymerase sigma factor [Comamonas fluminis]